MSIFAALPCYDIAAFDYRHEPLRRAVRDLGPIRVMKQQRSLLASNFNGLWCAAYNQREKLGLTHFLLLHDDIVPIGNHWLRQMLYTMKACDLRVLSVVAPLRNDSGETSTALRDGSDWRSRRMTVAQTQDKTLLSEDHDGLYINTGCLLIDMAGEWHRGLCFNIRDRIVVNGKGELEDQVVPEDWNMSLWLEKNQIRYGATGQVRLLHYDIRRKKAYKNWR